MFQCSFGYCWLAWIAGSIDPAVRAASSGGGGGAATDRQQNGAQRGREARRDDRGGRQRGKAEQPKPQGIVGAVRLRAARLTKWGGVPPLV